MLFPNKQRLDNPIRTRVLMPVAGVFTAVALMALLAVYTAAWRSDEVSVERQIRETRQSINNGLDELTSSQRGAAVWDPAVLEFRKPLPDLQWMDDNIGLWLHRVFKHDQVFVLNSRDQPIYAMSDGERAPQSLYRQLSPSFGTLVDRVRGRETDVTNPQESLHSQRVQPSIADQTGQQLAHAADLVRVRGRLAAATVMRVVPLTDAVTQKPGEEALILSVRYLDGSFLQELEQNNLIQAPRFSKRADASKTEFALAVVSGAGKPLGYFVWQPDLPGSTMLASLLPFVVLGLMVLGSVMAFLAFRVGRLMQQEARNLRDLETAHVELKASEAQTHHLAFHDALTGLPNRALFNDRADQAMVRVRNGDQAAILMLDLDRFKHVNDTWGHQAGDALIQEFGSRLAHIMGSRGTVARLGGDEFAILTTECTSTEATEALAETIVAAVRKPFEVLGNQAYVGVSIGIATAPAAGVDRTELMRKADIALYRAKYEGRDCYRAFSADMDDTVRARAALEEDLRLALKTGQGLDVHYQPQFERSGQTITGIEALARWKHPTRGFISPQTFVSIAEDAGLIGELGDWVMREACQVALEWPGVSIAVNLSPAQFRLSGFADHITSVVASAGVDPHQIELEVTEGILIDDDELVRASLRQLRERGFRIALDDFGTGYSSLSYLRKFEVDKIKIDRSFVQHLGQAVDSTAIVTAVVTLGHAMGLTVTAEGVESRAQSDFLNIAGCDELQGHLFSHALPADQLRSLFGTPNRLVTDLRSCSANSF